jgi:predicted nucleic acid-binding protein
MVVIADTSPFIDLLKIGRIELSKQYKTFKLKKPTQGEGFK